MLALEIAGGIRSGFWIENLSSANTCIDSEEL